ncbi:cycle-inhibiting factor [Providencia alcalifaciens]|uniref:cycle-inhibiting factor n=1 Tax=Providencia alcalifaciens TaxID=126385 RepID=UPI00044FA8EF|nr:cycle-inhibiting factor [Providencia alcalifaciens]EUC95495.1 putative cell cycle inhibiting factor [Providencia alcalifaciens PAL-2]
MLPSSINTHNAPINIPPTSPASNINAVFCKTPIYKQIQKLTQLMSEDKGINAIMNCDEYHIPISHKDPNTLCEKLEKNISSIAEEWGCSPKLVEETFGYINGFREPVCGLFANNMMKVFLDNDQETFDNTGYMPITELENTINKLPEDKNFILRIQDKALGHSYVIDISSGKNDSRQCFLYQTDLGEGVTRQITASEWMQTERSNPLFLHNFLSYIQTMNNNTVNQTLIAQIFDITQSPNLLRFERLCLSTFKESTFLLKEYTENLVLENIEQILSKRTT